VGFFFLLFFFILGLFVLCVNCLLTVPFALSCHNHRLVENVLCLINVSKNGISEREVQEVLGVSGEVFCQLFQWLGPLVVVRRGLMSLQYEACKDVVEFVYMSEATVFDGVCRSLAGYFEGLKRRKIFNSRVLEELPWLLEKIRDFELLKDCLTNLDFFEAVLELPSIDFLFVCFSFVLFCFVCYCFSDHKLACHRWCSRRSRVSSFDTGFQSTAPARRW